MVEQQVLVVEPHDTDTLAIGAVVGDLNAYVGAPAKTSRVITPDGTVCMQSIPASTTNASFMKAF